MDVHDAFANGGMSTETPHHPVSPRLNSYSREHCAFLCLGIRDGTGDTLNLELPDLSGSLTAGPVLESGTARQVLRFDLSNVEQRYRSRWHEEQDGEGAEHHSASEGI
jgi:hypothetical protein